MVVSIIGIGLIGGSMALSLKAKGFAKKVIGVDINKQHQKAARLIGLVDTILNLEEAVPRSDMVIIATPVNDAPEVLSRVLKQAGPEVTVLDVGSTKSNICLEALKHPNRGQFVATHPIAGTENTGPSAANHGLFDNKINIICEKEKSSRKALARVEALYDCLNMKSIYMDSGEHDKHIAYVSHISHISSFTLGLTVLDIEKDEKNIFNMAGSGFASTVRLAKSSPAMWAPIFEQNAKNVSDALGNYIDKLTFFKQMIDEGNIGEIYQLMDSANRIKKVLEGIETKNELMTK